MPRQLPDEQAIFFIRAKRGVKLSPAGQAALEHAVRLLDEAEALRASERKPGAHHQARVPN